jgi:uncharacterized protein (TIGR00297 family)
MFRPYLGFLLAACISLAARRTRSLSVSGAIAATVVGTAAIAAGWNWGALLITYFVSSTLFTHVGREQKDSRAGAIVAKGGERDAVQVLANGAMFAGAAAAMVVHPDLHWIALGAGALAASAADTWATEIGTLVGGEPRSILSGKVVAAGTSGAVTVIGSLAAVAGAGFIALVAVALGWSLQLGATVMLGGVAGALADSLLGATLQSLHWCDSCERETERMTHDCGTTTRRIRGFEWIDNDVVNFLSSAAGGLLAALLIR